jgi:type IV pilus assembly protein PilB
MASAAEDFGDLPLGTLLERRGFATSYDIAEALAAAPTQGKRLGEILVEWELVGERDVALLLAEQEELDFVDLGKYDLDPAALTLFPRGISRKHAVIPYAFDGDAALVAAADPTDGDALDAVLNASPRPVRFVVATRTEIEAALAEAYPDW